MVGRLHGLNTRRSDDVEPYLYGEIRVWVAARGIRGIQAFSLHLSASVG